MWLIKRPLLAALICVVVLDVLLIKMNIIGNAPPYSKVLEECGGKASAVVTGVVSRVVEKEGYSQIYVENAYIDDRYNAGAMIINTSKADVNYGDKVQAYGTITEFEAAGNPGEFDAKKYYESINIYYRCSADSVEVIDRNHNLWHEIIFRIKSEMKQSYDALCDEKDASVLVSIVLGDKSQLDMELKELYQKNGIAHVLAISGLHISIIGMGVYKGFRKMRNSFVSSAIISSFVILSYGVMTGNGISAMRALIMFVVSVMADVLGRTYDILSAVSLAGIVMILKYPMILCNCGFYLSFGAILGIVVVNGIIDRTFHVENKLIKALLVSASVNVVTLPVLAYFYYEIPVYGILLNIVVVPCMTLVMVSGIAGGVTGIFNEAAGSFLVAAAHYILSFYELLCKVVQRLPYNRIVLGKPEEWQILSYYLIIAVCLAVLYRHRSKIALTAIFAAVILLKVWDYNGVEVRVLDVGQGDGIYIQNEAGSVYMIDGGSSSRKNTGERILIPNLLSSGKDTVNYWIVTHLDKDHMSGLAEILENYPSCGIVIEHVVVAEALLQDGDFEEIMECCEEYGILVIPVKTGDTFKNGNFVLECLHPVSDYSIASKNDASVVLKLSYGEFSMLFTGDLEAKGEECVSKAAGDVDVLKVAHHGSSNSTTEEFLEGVMPEYGVISAGENNSYGHPHKELLERLEGCGAKTLITYETGAVIFRTDGEKLEVEKYLKE